MRNPSTEPILSEQSSFHLNSIDVEPIIFTQTFFILPTTNEKQIKSYILTNSCLFNQQINTVFILLLCSTVHDAHTIPLLLGVF